MRLYGQRLGRWSGGPEGVAVGEGSGQGTRRRGGSRSGGEQWPDGAEPLRESLWGPHVRVKLKGAPPASPRGVNGSSLLFLGVEILVEATHPCARAQVII